MQCTYIKSPAAVEIGNSTLCYIILDEVLYNWRAEASPPLFVELYEFCFIYLFIYIYVYIIIIIYIFQAVRRARAVNAQHANVGTAG